MDIALGVLPAHHLAAHRDLHGHQISDDVAAQLGTSRQTHGRHGLGDRKNLIIRVFLGVIIAEHLRTVLVVLLAILSNRGAHVVLVTGSRRNDDRSDGGVLADLVIVDEPGLDGLLMGVVVNLFGVDNVRIADGAASWLGDDDVVIIDLQPGTTSGLHTVVAVDLGLTVTREVVLLGRLRGGLDDVAVERHTDVACGVIGAAYRDEVLVALRKHGHEGHGTGDLVGKDLLDRPDLLTIRSDDLGVEQSGNVLGIHGADVHVSTSR